MKVRKLIHDFLVWRIRHISNKNFLIGISFLIGIISGLAAVSLKSSVHFIHDFLNHEVPDYLLKYLYVVFPLVGILLTIGFKYYFLKGKLGHGIPNLLYAISKKSSLVERDKMYSHMITSALTVGFGGSVGLEAPIVTTGSAFGSNLGRLFHLGQKKRTLLIGCGAASAIAAIFNSPIAGVIFALEVLLLELSIPAFIPLLISAVTGTILSKVILGDEILFSFSLTDPFEYTEVPYYILLGILTGMISVYFTRMTHFVETQIQGVRHIGKRAIIGGLALGILLFIFPPLYGEGYDIIKLLLNNQPTGVLEDSLFVDFKSNEWVLIAFVFALMMIKVFASALTIGAGGNGGIFAPSLFIGGISGFFMARLLNQLNFLPGSLSEKNFVLVGMAGVMSGVLQAPLTAIFLIAEITSGYMLILPLMIVAAISFFTISYFEPHSLYTKQLARKGHLYYHNKDKTVLTILQMNKLLEKDLIPVKDTGNLGDMVKVVSRSHRNLFPVIDDEGLLKGIILLDDIREIMFKPDMYEKIEIKDIMHAPTATVTYGETMEEVMAKFDKTGDWNLPVVNNGRYEGFLSKSKIFSHYRQLLIKQAREDTEIMG